MDVALHLTAGALLEKLAKGKAWLYVIPCFLSHAYIDSLNLWTSLPINFFGIQAGSKDVGPLLRAVPVSEAFTLDNLAAIVFMVISLSMFVVFLRAYWRGALVAWLSWDILWAVNEVAYLAGFNIPLLHNVLQSYITRGPVVLIMHVLMISFICVTLARQKEPSNGLGVNQRQM
jgi:hypothetical protein